MEDTLFLSNDLLFYTIEGEGKYAGYPSLFMRLSMCNLTCKGFASKDSPNGCDSYISWSVKNRKTFEEIFQAMEVLDPYTFENWVTKLKQGAIFKITGGEPFIQQKSLIAFIKAFIERYKFTPIIDFETNGTILPDEYWTNTVKATFTCSPKLSNNGDPEDKRYKPDVLKSLTKHGACFKFVVRTEQDMREVIDKYVNYINIPKELVWLMPMCGSRDEQSEVSHGVAELCKKYNYKFSPRLHLMIWDKALKV